MRRGIWLAAIALFLAAPRGSGAQQAPQASPSQSQAGAQSSAQQDPLVVAARKAREAQKNAPKAPTVFTNDNMPASPGAVSVVGTASSGKPSAASSKAAGKSKSKSQADEAAWRKKFADARHKLAQDQAELSVMQRESSQLQLQYYPDPSKGLTQSYSRSDIIKKQNAIAAKQKQIDADQQAISNLEDALRKAGGDPGWARE